MNDIDRIWERLESDFKALMGHHDRLTALESRPCNCSAASSAGSGGTVGSASSDASATANKSSAGSAFGAESTPPDPVSAAIHLYPNRPAWLTDEMLPLPEGTERLYRDRATGYVGAYPCGRVWFEHGWAIRAVPEYACVKDGDEVYHVPPPAPVAKAGHDAGMAWECPKAHLSADMQPSDVAGDSPWCRFWSRYKDRYTIAEFNRFIAAEVAAAKAKPNAETAEEVAWRTARDVLDTVFNCNGQGYGNMLDKLTPIITAAIKRERGEA